MNGFRNHLTQRRGRAWFRGISAHIAIFFSFGVAFIFSAIGMVPVYVGLILSMVA
jgi:hypothetical protein